MTECKLLPVRRSARPWIAAALLFLCGCGENGAPERPAEPPRADDPVAERMGDPVYLAKLERQRAVQRKLMTAVADARAALDAAKAAAEPDRELVAELEAKLQDGEKAFEFNRQQTMAIIRERMRQQKGATP